jgi:hypothetical protein
MFLQKRKKDNILEGKKPTLPTKSKPQAINIWQKEQFLKEFNGQERAFFLELAQKTILEGYQICLDLYFFCYFKTIKFRFLSHLSPYDTPFRYLYALGLRELNEQIDFYRSKLEK